MQTKIWLLTIPRADWTPCLPPGVAYCKGQCESGGTTGYEHWQLIAYFKRTVRLRAVKSVFANTAHCEPSRSAAADAYVEKEETRIEGTQFEFGTKPVRRNSAHDWEEIRSKAIEGRISEVPADVYIRCYSALRRISADHMRPEPQERMVHVYWGPTGTGKSRRAWNEAGLDAYPKDPLSKFWDGYSGQEHVIIDEFRGTVNISHVLRWFDRYPVIVEIKGSSVPLKARVIWITSNLHPREWYPDLDEKTLEALLRRLNIIKIDCL